MDDIDKLFNDSIDEFNNNNIIVKQAITPGGQPAYIYEKENLPFAALVISDPENLTSNDRVVIRAKMVDDSATPITDKDDRWIIAKVPAGTEMRVIVNTILIIMGENLGKILADDLEYFQSMEDGGIPIIIEVIKLLRNDKIDDAKALIASNIDEISRYDDVMSLIVHGGLYDPG